MHLLLIVRTNAAHTEAPQLRLKLVTGSIVWDLQIAASQRSSIIIIFEVVHFGSMLLLFSRQMLLITLLKMVFTHFFGGL